MKFIKVIRDLLPNGKVTNLSKNSGSNIINKFFNGLSDFFESIRLKAGQIFLNILPQETEYIELHERQLGLPLSLTDEQERRDRLDATYKSLQGGQGIDYIQGILQENGFDLYVHPAYSSDFVMTAGQKITPEYENPRIHLKSSVNGILEVMQCGEPKMQCGNPEAVCGNFIYVTGYALVNKIAKSGSAEEIQDYEVPTDTETHPYFMYVGAETFPDIAEVESSRKNELERILLEICPAHLWIGLLVEYV